MRSLCTLLAGTALAGILVCLASGCGGAESGLAKTPEVKENPPMSAMPGYDPVTKGMKTNMPAKAKAGPRRP